MGLLDVHGHLVYVGAAAREVVEGLEQLGQQLQRDHSAAVRLQVVQATLNELDPTETKKIILPKKIPAGF